MEDKEPERYYDWMLWKLRQEDPDWYSRDPKHEGERLVTHDNPNHHKIIKERFEHETERSIRQNLPLYRSLSGLGLAQEIAATNPELVIDLGCGANPFKGIIPNLIGMDLTKFPTSDLVRPIQHAHNIFQGAIADWVLMLGPWSCTDKETHKSLVAEADHLLKPNGTIVAHSGNGWSNDYIIELGEHFGFATKFDGIGDTDYRKMTRKHYNIQKKALKYRKQKHGIIEEENPKRVVWRWTYGHRVDLPIDYE